MALKTSAKARNSSIGSGASRLLLGDGREIEADENAGNQSEQDEAGLLQLVAHGCLVSAGYFSPTHFKGSSAWPKCLNSKYKPVSGLPPLLPTEAIASPPLTAWPAVLKRDSLLPYTDR
jgi:hypothetical protein